MFNLKIEDHLQNKKFQRFAEIHHATINIFENILEKSVMLMEMHKRNEGTRSSLIGANNEEFNALRREFEMMKEFLLKQHGNNLNQKHDENMENENEKLKAENEKMKKDIRILRMTIVEKDTTIDMMRKGLSEADRIITNLQEKRVSEAISKHEEKAVKKGNNANARNKKPQVSQSLGKKN